MKLFLTILSILLSAGIHAQNQLDSLWNVWANENESDSSRLEAIASFNDLRYEIRKAKKGDSSLYFAQLYSDYAQEKSNPYHQAASLNFLAKIYSVTGNFDLGAKTYRACIEFCQASNNLELEANSLRGLGAIYDRLDNYDSAIVFMEKAIAINKAIENLDELSSDYQNIGVMYFHKGNYYLAINSYKRSLHYAKEVGNEGLSNTLDFNIGAVYVSLKDYQTAIEHFNIALNYFSKNKDSLKLAYVNNSLGVAYLRIDSSSLSKAYFLEALNISNKIGLKRIKVSILINIANIHINQKNYEAALDYALQALELSEKTRNRYLIAKSYNKIGSIYFNLNNFAKAREYAQKGLNLSREIESLKSTQTSLELNFKLFKMNNNYQEALSIHEELKTIEDSLNIKEVNSDLRQQEFKLQYEKKMEADSIKNAEAIKVEEALLKAERAESLKQKQKGYFLWAGLGLTVIFGGFIYKRYRLTSNQKVIIERQKEQVDKAFDSLAEKNREIMDSIQYAKRIQSAILPPERLVKECLANSFILYLPKDVVAGDFYWLEKKGELICYAAADCTGHGVPGAMVSVICVNGLNRSVREFNLTDPAKILEKTRELVIREFEKSDDDVQDGMDISLCVLNTKTGDLSWAGANNPIWIVRKGTETIEEIKGDKQPIGKYDRAKNFTSHALKVHEGDTIYTFSDGYIDQFGGPLGKKYKSTKFKKTLIEISQKEIGAQRTILEREFENWRGEEEQLDDICVMGVRI